jgi:hypothetical protein
MTNAKDVGELPVTGDRVGPAGGADRATER